MPDPAALRVAGLSVAYAGAPALRDVSLGVPAAGAVAVLGANGAGKSTLLRAVSGLVRPSAGQIWYAGTSLARLRPHQVAALGIGHVPEGHRTFPRLTVAENLDLGGFLRGGACAADLDRVRELFPVLARRWSATAGTLSGGQQQMLAIARALVARPKLLLLDEPSLGLAPAVVADIAGALRRVREEGTALLLVEQDAGLALGLVDHGIVLETGRVVATGTAAELRADPRLMTAYLG